MPSLMSTVGNFFSQYAKPLQSIAGLAGAGTNIYSGIQNMQNLGQYNATQKYIQSLVQSPQKAQTAAAAYTQPLSAGLTDAVTNQVQAQLAERGMGGSPGAMSASLAQALAPYVQQNQQTGLNALFQMLGMGSSARPATLPSVDLSKLMASLNMGSSSGSNPYATIWNANQNMAGNAAPTPTFPDLGDVSEG